MDGADNAETIWHKLVHDVLWDPKVSLFVESPDIKVDKTTKGYQIKIKRARAGGTGATTNFRGEWLASAQYAAGDEVVISLGANRGIYKYVAFAPSTGHEPWVGGGYWFKMSDGLGQWM